MKALVTGASGFIGGGLVRRLLAGGEQVVCLVRATSDPARLAGLDVERRVAALEDPHALRRAVRGVDVVFHAAGLTRARGLREYLAVNAEGTGRLIEAVLTEGVCLRRFVYVSSLAAVGPNPSPEPLDETAPPRPLGAYGRSKLAGERIVLGYADRLAVTIVRPPAVYGPGDRNFLPMFRSALRLGRVPVVGRGEKHASFVYIEDLAEGLVLAGSHPAAEGRTYFLSGGTHTTGQVVEAVAGAVGIPPRALRVPSLLARLAGEFGQLKWLLTGRAQLISRRKVRDLLQPRWTCTARRAEAELGFRPRVPLAEGMQRTAEWYFEQGWLKRRG